MNILMCSVGRRGELLKDFHRTMMGKGKVVATDLSPYAPALYYADKQYIVPPIDNPNYIDVLLDICKKESISAVTTFIDPEISVLAQNRNKFEELGVVVLAPYEETAGICFDKYLAFQYFKKNGIPTVMTWGALDEFEDAWRNNKVSFPVFVKPRTGSGSVGARTIYSHELLKEALEEEPSLIIQEYMEGIDLDADVYVDTITHEAVAAFSKKKIETRIGGASKTISFKDDKLFQLIPEIVSIFEFNGPIDIDFFCINGEYYVSEINPRFGGAYLHAYECGIDFIKCIQKNLNGEVNEVEFGGYEEDIIMMMYDGVVFRKKDELAK